MAKEMLINVSAGEECRIALINEGKLEELYMERTSATSHVGNIYKGKVTNVEPSIQAAFVDFGIGRNGFLHISDLMPSYFGKKGGDVTEPVGRKLSRRDRPPIQQCLRKGDEIIVQIIKEGIGTKGPTLSSYLSIPGRVLVMMPGMAKMGISKKIEDEEERARLRKILDGLKPPKDCGFIIRTAGIGKSKLEIERDLKYLARLWEQLKKKIDKEKAPVELYTEGDLVTRTVRDVFSSDVDQIIIDEADTAKKVKDFIKLAMPRTKNKVVAYDETLPLFHKYDIEAEIEGIYSRRVPLPSGGSLIIDQTEAIVAIDVNSGKFRDHSDAETTAFKTDLEAADEIPRQLKLRDMGGVIICDFIDLRFERHRREVEERLHNNLKNDRAKTRMLRMSQFGIIEMTRQRMRPSLKKSIYQECGACRAHGMVKTPESMSLDVMRKLRIAASDEAVVRVLLTLHPEVASYLQNRKRAELATLETETQKRVIITADRDLPMDEVKFELYDSRDGYIYIAELGMALPQVHHQQRQGGGGGRGHDRGRDRDRDRGQHKPKHDRHHEENESIDAEDLFSDEGDEPKKKSIPPKAVATKGGAIEQTGDEDEATVVDVDEGGSELPGHAPDAFYEPGDRDRYRDRRRGGRDFRNNRDSRGGGGNRNGERQQGGGQQNRSNGGDDRQRNDRQQRDDRPRDDRPQRDNRQPQPQGDHPQGDDQGQGGGRRRRRRRGRRGRGRGGQDNGGGIDSNGNPLPQNGHRDQRQAESSVAEAGYDYDDDSHDRPAPGNELSDHNTPQAQLQRRDEAAKGSGRGRGGGRRGRGRGRGGKEASRPTFDRTGLPDDEELEREAAELEARQAQLAAEAETAQPIDEMAHDDDVDDGEEPTEAELTTPPPEAAPKLMEGDEDVPRSKKAAESAPAAPAPRSRSRSSTRRTPPPQPEVVKTGTVDKHLADDEPIDHEPVKRPRSYRDLDELPDFDDD